MYSSHDEIMRSYIFSSIHAYIHAHPERFNQIRLVEEGNHMHIEV